MSPNPLDALRFLWRLVRGSSGQSSEVGEGRSIQVSSSGNIEGNVLVQGDYHHHLTPTTEPLKPPELGMVFAETDAEEIDCDYIGDGTRLVCTFTPRLVNRGQAAAVHFQATMWFEPGTFRYRAPLSYQCSNAFIPDDYWVFGSDSKGIRVQVNGRGNYQVPGGQFLDLAVLPITTSGGMAGKEFEIPYRVTASNTDPVEGVLRVRVRDQPRS